MRPVRKPGGERPRSAARTSPSIPRSPEPHSAPSSAASVCTRWCSFGRAIATDSSVCADTWGVPRWRPSVWSSLAMEGCSIGSGIAGATEALRSCSSLASFWRGWRRRLRRRVRTRCATTGYWRRRLRGAPTWCRRASGQRLGSSPHFHMRLQSGGIHEPQDSVDRDLLQAAAENSGNCATRQLGPSREFRVGQLLSLHLIDHGRDQLRLDDGLRRPAGAGSVPSPSLLRSSSSSPYLPQSSSGELDAPGRCGLRCLLECVDDTDGSSRTSA
jgi:hypothetical protein